MVHGGVKGGLCGARGSASDKPPISDPAVVITARGGGCKLKGRRE
jgi:hypothetical protein